MERLDPVVSVVLPVYNAESYIQEAVESILAQTYSDFEFLIIDDGSTDGSLAILQKYADEDPRIRLRSRPNAGLVATLNEMLAEARGEYIARMDADDISLPNRFEQQVEFLNSHPEVALLGSWVDVIDPQGRRLRTAKVPVESDALVQQMLDRGGQFVFHPAIMARREAFAQAGGYIADRFPAEDLHLFLKMAETAQLANLEEVLLKYREHPTKIGFQHRARQEEVITSILNDARQTRGLPELPPVKQVDNANMEETELKWAWWALGSGEVATARHYAWRSLLRHPLSMKRWNAALCAARGY